MILSYKRDMTHNYMIPEIEDTLDGQDYQIHMLMENHVEGLLPCSINKVDGKSRYFYDITSRQSMESVYEKEYLGEKELRILFRGLYKTLLEVKRFLLNADKVVLEPDLIYMDIETKEPLFTYLPSFSGNILVSFQQFAAKLLQMLDESDTAAVLLGYEIYRKSMEVNYSLEKLLKDTAFGGAHEPIPDKTENAGVQAKIFAEPAVTETVQVSQEQKPNAQVQNRKSLLLFAGTGILVILGIVFAVWFWKLNIMQVGGIVFLLASFLAWGISSDGKHKKGKSVQMESARKQEPARKQESIRKQESVRKQEVEKIQEPDRIEEKNMGATVLLRAGEAYVPHLSLISMNPRERNSVVLLNDTYTVGKLKNKVDIYIDHPSVSRIHAKICKEGTEYYLQDLNSTNGTFVNGQPLTANEKVRIQLSDEICFADLGYYVGKC